MMPTAMLRTGRALLDLASVAGAFAAAYVVAGSGAAFGDVSGTTLLGLAVLFGLLMIAFFSTLDLFRLRVSVLDLAELERVIRGMALTSATFLAIVFLVGPDGIRPRATVVALGFALVGVVAQRRIFSAVLRARARKRGPALRALIHGCGPVGQLLMRRLVQAPQAGRLIVGFLDDTVPVGTTFACRLSQISPEVVSVPVIGRSDDIQEILGSDEIDELFLTSALDGEQWDALLRHCRSAGVQVAVVPDLAGVRADQLVVEEVAAIPVLRPYRPSNQERSLRIKRAFDLITASILLLLSAPLWVVIAVLIRLDGPGPVLFAQNRVGLDGRLFRMLKFRTMRPDAEPYAPSPDHRDPRVTRVGRFLRRSGLDELPQLLNVLRGEMSMVGPRPEMPFIVARYDNLERQRLQVVPGLTGVWQLSAERGLFIHEHIEYDLYYIQHRSLTLDLLVLVATVTFTLRLVGTAFLRGRETPPSTVPAPARLPWPERASVLVALDQRRGRDGAPESWQLVLPTARELAGRCRVRLLVSDANRPVVDRLLEEDGRGPDGGIEYVSYRSRVQLRQAALGASMIITDLPHVEDWALEAGIHVLTRSNGRFERSVRAEAGTAGRLDDGLRALLADGVPPSREAGTGVAGPSPLH